MRRVPAGGRFLTCVRGGHLQNGKPVRHQNPKKMGKKWKMAPGLKWPKNGRRNGKNREKMAKIPFWGHFSISVAIFRPFQAGGHFPIFSHFFRILATAHAILDPLPCPSFPWVAECTTITALFVCLVSKCLSKFLNCCWGLLNH